jgi:hypothetical protein
MMTPAAVGEVKHMQLASATARKGQYAAAAKTSSAENGVGKTEQRRRRWRRAAMARRKGLCTAAKREAGPAEGGAREGDKRGLWE